MFNSINELLVIFNRTEPIIKCKEMKHDLINHLTVIYIKLILKYDQLQKLKLIKLSVNERE